MADQFYTKQKIAKKCWKKLTRRVKIGKYDVILEPSGGTGSFYNLLPHDKRIGIDIEPKHKDIIECDFFDYKPDAGKKYIVVGNPPFGKVSSTAVKFFNYASTFSDIIAFIIPRTFKRVSIQNRLSMDFHIIYNYDLPLTPCCFEPKMMAKCCFQIWKRKKYKREMIILPEKHGDFDFISYGDKDAKGQPTVPKGADFALKAYGCNCGKITTDMKRLRPKSWHFISSNIEVKKLIKRFRKLDYSISKDTVRQDSIGRKELIHLYIGTFG
jgi:hypothetical protein|uniref:Methyltransferase n=1 Tax=viral metagenome TaxID=1070528 RepID=A0A6C0IUG2_9ZZZZ